MPMGTVGQPKRGQDWLMPVSNIIRIMRRVLPMHAKIADDAKETIQQCVSEFISFVTSEANDKCQREQRKTITADDILWAALKLGFDDYVEPLGIYLKRYRDIEGDHKGSVRSEPLPLSLQMGKREQSDSLALVSDSANNDPALPSSSSSSSSASSSSSCMQVAPFPSPSSSRHGATIPIGAYYKI